MKDKPLSRQALFIIRFLLKSVLLYLFFFPGLGIAVYGAYYVMESISRVVHVTQGEVSIQIIGIVLFIALASIPIWASFLLVRHVWEYVNLSFGTPFLASKAAADRLTRKADKTRVIDKALRMGDHTDDFLRIYMETVERGAASIVIDLNSGLTVFSASREWRNDFDGNPPVLRWRVTTYIQGDWEKHLSDISARAKLEESGTQ